VEPDNTVGSRAETITAALKERRRDRFLFFLIGAAVTAFLPAWFNGTTSLVRYTTYELLEQIALGAVLGLVVCGIFWFAFKGLTARSSIAAALSSYSLGNPGGLVSTFLYLTLGGKVVQLGFLYTGHATPNVQFDVLGGLSIVGSAIAVIAVSNRADRIFIDATVDPKDRGGRAKARPLQA